MQELLTRLVKLGEADPHSELRQVALRNHVIPPGLNLPLSGMGLRAETTQAEPAHSPAPEEDGGECSGVLGHVRPEGSDASLPLPSSTRCGDTMETPTEPERGSRVPAHAGVLPVQRVEPLGGDGEGAQSLSKFSCDSIGSDTGPTPNQGQDERTGQREGQIPAQDGEVMVDFNHLDRQSLLHTVSTISLPKVPQRTTLHYKVCTKYVPVLLGTTKLAPSTSRYYFVLQSLHKVLPSTTSYYKACTKYVPVLLRTTKLAQSTSQYYFVLQSLHKVRPSTTLFVLRERGGGRKVGQAWGW